MLVGVLGPICAVGEDGEALHLGGPTQQRLVALLAAAGPIGVTGESLTEALWTGTKKPVDPEGALRTAIRRVREVLGGGSVLVRAGVVRFDVVEIDSVRFEETVARARNAGTSPTALALWAEAVALWRGPAFAEFADLESVELAARRLEELRVEARESWFDARLAAGEGRELVADIESAVAEHPLREGFRAQQMTVLSTVGRQAEALRAFQEFRADVTDIGLEPSAELRHLDSRIAAGKPIQLASTRHLRGYELSERLGEGAFSVVYRAAQPSVGRDVAVKQIRAELANRPEFIRQFEAEAHLVARLEHPHIVPLYDYWREPGSAYLVMRYLRGGSLAGAVLEGPLPLDTTLAVVRDVAEALDAAHRAGVIHRDVKPANILLDDDGRAFLSDFGIAVEEASALDPEAWLSSGSPVYASPEQLRREAVGPAADVHGLGISVFEALTGRVPFPDETTMAGLLERQLNDPIPLVRSIQTDIPAAVDAALQRATAKLPDDRFASAGEFATALAHAAGETGWEQPVEVVDRNPYKGLRAFDEADAGDFVGRERLVEILLRSVASHRLTALVGPSGSGKSSVVRGGLIPAIRQGRITGSGHWFVTTMIPGRTPFTDLAAALLSVAVDPPADLEAALSDDDLGIARSIRRIVPADRELVLVIDQFEELFTLSAPSQCRRFLDGLVAAAADEATRLRVVLTLRADHYDRPLRHEGFARLIEPATIAIPPLAADELEAVIVEPARAVGASFEAGLVATIAADVADQPGALPLLQYALTELHEHRTGEAVLTLEAYDLLGGVAGALARRAEDLYETADGAQKDAIRHLFARLVSLGEGADDTRRRVELSELGDDAATIAILEYYGDARLLSFDRHTASRAPTVEVAHEALIRDWPRLRSWIDEDRDGLRVLRHLADTARSWDESGRDPEELYRGGRLEAADELRMTRTDDLNATEREFLNASIERRSNQREQERRRVRRLRALLAVASIIAVIAATAGVVAFQQRSRADDNATRAAEQATIATELAFDSETRRLIADSARLATTDRRLALLLAAEAHKRDPSTETLGALQRALVATPGFLGYLGGEAATSSGFNQEGTLLAAVVGPELIVYDLETLDPTMSIPFVAGGWMSLADDRKIIVTAEPSGLVAFLNFSGEPTAEALQLDVEVVSLAASPTSSIAVVGTADGSLIAVDVDAGIELWRADTDHGGPVDRLEFGADGRRIASAFVTGLTIKVWDPVTGAAVTSIEIPDAAWSIAVDADSDSIIYADGDSLTVFDAATGEPTGTDYQINVSSLATAPIDSLNRVATASGNQLIELHDLTTGTSEQLQFDAQIGRISQFAVAADGARLAAAGTEGISLWSLDGSGLLAQALPAEVIGRPDLAVLSPDGNYLAAVSNTGPDELYRLDHEIRLVQVETELPNIWVGSTGLMTANYEITETRAPVVEIVDRETLSTTAFSPGGVPWSEDISPDGRLLAIGRLDGYIRVLDVDSGDEVALLPTLGLEQNNEGPMFVNVVAFNADGTRLVSAAGFGGIDLFDVATWERIDGLPVETGNVTATWSPDGQTIAIGSFTSGEITIRDASDLEAVHTALVGHKQVFAQRGVTPMFSPDGQYLYSQERTGTRVWDLTTGVQIGDPFPSDGQLGVGSVSTIGLATASRNGSTILWSLDPTSWPDLVCQIVGRNLTTEEWGRLGPTDQAAQPTCP